MHSRNINQKGIISIALALKVKANLFQELHPEALNENGTARYHILNSNLRPSQDTTLYQSKICTVLFPDKHKALGSEGERPMESICRGAASAGPRRRP